MVLICYDNFFWGVVEDEEGGEEAVTCLFSVQPCRSKLAEVTTIPT